MSDILVSKNAVEYDFFTCDMWFAKGAEWKTEGDMLKYLKTHFDICLRHMKECEK